MKIHYGNITVTAAGFALLLAWGYVVALIITGGTL